MFRQPRRLAMVLAALLGTCAVTEAPAQVIVVPNARAATDGNGSVTPTAPQRFMQVFDASQFAALSGPVLITQFAFRPDAIPGPSGPITENFQIFLSTTSRSVAGLSSTFAENIGADNTRVLSGALTLLTANLPGPGDTRQFDIVYPFTTPFRYDPRDGNLLLDFQYASASGQLLRRDAEFGNPTINSVASVGSPTATTGTITGGGAVIQFTTQPIPEPTTFALVGLGTCGVLGAAWRRKRACREVASR
jgi:hypothetical protein